MALLVLLVGIFSSGSIYGIAKDVFYFSVFPVALIAGIGAGRGLIPGDLSLPLMLSGVVAGCIFLWGTTDPSLAGLPRDEYRAAIGFASPSVMLLPFALSILSFRKSSSIVSVVLACVLLSLIPLLIYVADSRSQWVIFAVGLIGFCLRRRPQTLSLLLIIIIALVLALALPVYTVFVSQRVALEIVSQLPGFLREWIPYPYSGLGDINDFWRAFEGYAGYKSWADTGLFGHLFGRGGGATSPLGLGIKLGPDPESTFTEVPVFHNGFIYILVKAGIVGVLLLVRCLALMHKLCFSYRPYGPTMPTKFLIIGSIVLTFPTTSGWFSPGGLNLLTGFLFGLMLRAEQTSMVQPRDHSATVDQSRHTSKTIHGEG
ncbi:hypothetical protein [Alsobacter sp. SYSU BS001988]